MDHRRERALVLFGMCLASKAIRSQVDATRMVETDVGAAIQSMLMADAGASEADAMVAVDDVLESVGVRRQADEKRTDAVIGAVLEDWKARVRRRLLHMAVAPKLFPHPPGTLRKIVEEEDL